MFATYPPFKYPLQFSDQLTMWTAVELGDPTPWFIATVMDPNEQVERRFLLARSDDVIQFADQAPLGKLIALQLVLSPSWSPSGDWAMISIRRVARKRHRNKEFESVVVTGSDGVHYGGYPVERMKGDPGSLELLAEL